MLKRILLIVGITVSFAPAAFADNTGVFGFYTCPHTVGVNSECQLSAAMSDGATQCDKQKALNAMVADNLANGYNADGSSRAGAAK